MAIVAVSFTGCDLMQESTISKSIVDDHKESSSREISGNSDYVKPEGWVTVQSAEYPFAIDIPNDNWFVDVNSCNCGDNEGIEIKSSDRKIRLAFDVQKQIGRCKSVIPYSAKKFVMKKYDVNDPKDIKRLVYDEGLDVDDCSHVVEIPYEERLKELERNDNYVEQYGEVFKYFKAVTYTANDREKKIDDPYFINTLTDETIRSDDNTIMTRIEPQTPENIELVKTIIKSFRITK